MLLVIPARAVLLLGLLGTLLLNGLSLALRLPLSPEQRARTDPEEPFPGFWLLDGTFNADGEANVTTWFSAALLLSIALVSAGVAVRERQGGSRWRWHWLLLAVTFCYLSLDELAHLDLGGVLFFSWVVLGAPLVLLFAAVFVPFLLALPRRTAGLLLLSGAIFVGGALGMELVGGWVASEGAGSFSSDYVWATTVEELLENLGAALCLYAIADYAADRFHSGRSNTGDDAVGRADADGLAAEIPAGVRRSPADPAA